MKELIKNIQSESEKSVSFNSHYSQQWSKQSKLLYLIWNTFLTQSTCSIFKEENEDVVEKVLLDFKDQVKVEPISLEGYHTGRTDLT